MAFLDKFQDNFNVVVDVYRPHKIKNSIGEEENTYQLHLEQVQGILLLKKEEYQQYINNNIEYIKTTHRLRTYILDIKEKDKVIDQDGNQYEVVFVSVVHDLDGTPDHMIILLNKLI